MDSKSQHLPDLSVPVRVRIAPSPTGDPHVGTAYIALFNYVFAKKNQGQFLLRIEDTDQTRSTQASEDAILRALRWVGLTWDEGPDVGGPVGPYRQSERTAIYQKHAQILLEKGEAYRCFCTSDRLEAMRKAQRAQNQMVGYDRFCRYLSKTEIEERLAKNLSYVVRLAMPTDGETSFTDQLRGIISIENNAIDDQILLKSDGFPTYHLANVVDDHLMKITHVIRAEEWIISTPKHIQLYKAFGWTPPVFVHMPLLRNPDRSKISKRKNPVSLDYYRDAGFLPEALLNFLGLMGFSYGDNVEKFSIEQMIHAFDLSKVSPGEPVFDLQKLRWLNALYLREMSTESLLSRFKNWKLSDSFLLNLLKLEQERIETLADFIPAISFFFAGDLEYQSVKELLIPKNRTAEETAKILVGLVDYLDENLKTWSHDSIEQACRAYAESVQWKTKELFMGIRISVTGKTAAPPLFDTMLSVGKDLCKRRLRLAAQALLSTI